MHHLDIGATHCGERCILIADDTTVTVIHTGTGTGTNTGTGTGTGEILVTNTISPNNTY